MSDQLRLIELLVDRYQPFRDLIMNACEHGSAPVSTCSQPNCEARETLRLLNSVLLTRPLTDFSGKSSSRIPVMAHWEGSRKTKLTIRQIFDMENFKFPQANLLLLLYRHGIPMKANPAVQNDYRWMPTNEDMLDLIDLPAWRAYTAEPMILTFEYYLAEDAAALRDKYVQPGAADAGQ